MIVHRLIESGHIISIKSTYLAEDYARIFIDDIACLHDILLFIILDKDSQSTSGFRRSFKNGLGTKVKLSTTFHPQTDGQVEHTIQNL